MKLMSLELICFLLTCRLFSKRIADRKLKRTKSLRDDKHFAHINGKKVNNSILKNYTRFSSRVYNIRRKRRNKKYFKEILLSLILLKFD